MKALVLVSLVALIQASYATLLIKGPSQPIVEGDTVTLECSYSDSDQNISLVRFENFYRSSHTWHPVYLRSSCFYWPAMPTQMFNNTISMTFRHVSRYTEVQGPYRCVSDAENVTAADKASDPLALKVHYMGLPSLSREGYFRHLTVPQELKVQTGEDVVLTCSASSSEKPSFYWHKEGSDWILPSSTLTLRKASVADEGQYTCNAEHPSVESLKEARSVKITVLPEDTPWYESSNGRLILMTSAAGVCLLVFILSVSVFLCRRAKKTKNSRGPIDDHSQKKPIYKGSSESLPSISADKQPLV